jgi:hypothetical protein
MLVNSIFTNNHRLEFGLVVLIDEVNDVLNTYTANSLYIQATYINILKIPLQKNVHKSEIPIDFYGG